MRNKSTSRGSLTLLGFLDRDNFGWLYNSLMVTGGNYVRQTCCIDQD